MLSSVQKGLHLACFFFNSLFHLIIVKSERMKLESLIFKNFYLFQIVSNDPELNLVPWNCKVIIEPRHPRAQFPLLGSSELTVLQQIEADCSGSHYEEAGR